MSVPVKHSVAVVIRRNGLILAIRRPDDETELPGIWGLPAGSFQPGESLEQLVLRIGRDKLGVQLKPIRMLAQGSQQRPAYRLQMELWEASMTGTPTHPAWKWSDLDVLKEGQTSGSLCCELALRSPADGA